MSLPGVLLDSAALGSGFTPPAAPDGPRPAARFVELVGLPGAGKTTVARAAAEQLRAAGYRVAEDDLPPVQGAARMVRYARFVAFCVRQPRLLSALLRYTIAIRPWSAERIPFAVGVLVHAFGAAEARRGADVVLVSQGALQSAWSVAVRGSTPARPVVERLIDALWPIVGGAIVHVDVHPDQAVARIAQRTSGESRFDALPADEAAAQLRPLAAHLSTMTDTLRARGDSACLQLDGRVSPSENAAALVDFVTRPVPANVARTMATAGAGRQRRIALFVPSLEIGGAERVFVNLSGGFLRRGFAVDLLLIHKHGIYLPQVPPNVRIVVLSGKRALFIIPSLARYLRRERPEALLATLTYANIAAVIARRIAGVRTRVTVREANALTREAAGATEMKDRQLPRAARWFYPWADAIVAVSAGAADSLVDATGTDRARVHVLDNPVVNEDLTRLAAEPPDHPWFSAEASVPVVVAAGRLTTQKDFPTLLRAFAAVRAKRQARLVILGEGELREPLEQLVRELGMEADVSMPGVKSNPFAYMSRAAVFVLSSAWEGSPGVLIQAMASGAPVIATDCVSGPREILNGGEFGPLVTVGDVAGLADAMEKTLSGPRQPPPPSAWKRFSIETSVDAYLKVLGIC